MIRGALLTTIWDRAVSVSYAPGAPIADFNASAPYFTTIQQHSFTTEAGERGIIGKLLGETCSEFQRKFTTRTKPFTLNLRYGVKVKNPYHRRKPETTT